MNTILNGMFWLTTPYDTRRMYLSILLQKSVEKNMLCKRIVRKGKSKRPVFYDSVQ